jgi:hypothetical protein
MKSAVFPPVDPPPPYSCEAAVVSSANEAAAEDCSLTTRDLRAFTSRMFLENALNISHPNGTQSHSTYSVNFIDALKNVCDQFPTNDVIKVRFERLI